MSLTVTPEFVLFILILMRMSGFVFLNPVLGRKNIPALFKTGMVFVLAIGVFPSAKMPDTEVTSAVVLGVLLLKEFALGYLVGFVMQLFDMVVTYAGAVIDFQMGLSMSTVYDAQNGTQTAMTGNILQIYYLLLFFAVDGHLALIKILSESGKVVPYAGVILGPDAARSMLNIFVECIVLAVKLAFPIIAFEFLMEIATGLLMRIIPQINLFVISIQLRVILGVIMMVFMISPAGDFLNNLITDMIGAVQDILRIAGS
ncbi:flagellar biosynthetic protein FliR [Muricomes intestini]|jgi:flagellar biosynthetic protein FliR|uniref:Flagellar biosynthetic protein FliR n=1 Tax=Muricomes intestini TaxID=1796634 RepID=A0A4R3KI07_9FIRM|nr:flagellar biosynthetic protein FliR [Muricomes intestini]TCS82789.1 flagellar biosynthetic protein FliR [Muricomes intestini]HAX51247.1 flagellar biosynthetic protein FliR [Lachnospiraceae bacterium]HCR83304.1 flagellar biosynthetic protein FliR [Lachnospiraceae bacterium]